MRKIIEQIKGFLGSNKEQIESPPAPILTGITAEDCIIPRAVIPALYADFDITDIYEAFMASKLEFLPICYDNLDNIIGCVSVFTINQYLKNKVDFHLRQEDIQNVIFLSANTESLNILKSLYENKTLHVVLDEFGGTYGILTPHSLIDAMYNKNDFKGNKDIYCIKGTTGVEKLKHLCSKDFSNDYDAKTIGGLIAENLGRIPKNGEIIIIDDIKFTIKSASDRAVHEVSVSLIK